jgi:hypothetical protein
MGQPDTQLVIQTVTSDGPVHPPLASRSSRLFKLAMVFLCNVNFLFSTFFVFISKNLLFYFVLSNLYLLKYVISPAIPVPIFLYAGSGK